MNSGDKISNCIWHEKQADNTFLCKECKDTYNLYNNGLTCCK